jgi:hypothetical protein
LPDFASKQSVEKLTGKGLMPYHLITQSAQQVLRPENSPPRNISEYLVKTDQGALTNTISIYSLRGDSAEQVRLFYMNDAALAIWREMGHTPEIQQTTRRPPRKAELCFGVPFSE